MILEWNVHSMAAMLVPSFDLSPTDSYARDCRRETPVLPHVLPCSAFLPIKSNSNVEIKIDSRAKLLHKINYLN